MASSALAAVQVPMLFSALGGVLGALLVPLMQCTFCSPKEISATEGARYSDPKDLLWGFGWGSAIANCLSIPMDYASGIPVANACAASGIVFLLYSPLHIILGCGGGAWLTRRKGIAALVGCAATAGFVFLSNYSPDATTVLRNEVGRAAIWVAVSWATTLGIVAVQQAALTTVLPLYLDLVLMGLAMLAFSGNRNTSWLEVYLAVVSVIGVPCTIYTLQLSAHTFFTVPQFYGADGQSLVPKPIPHYDGPAEAEPELVVLCRRPPLTSPAVPLLPNPPDVGFLAATRHVFVVPNYGETVGVLTRTLATLASHPNSRRRYGVYLAMEAQEADWEAKYASLHALFAPRFAWMGHSVHTIESGEMAGKGANLNAAMRKLMDDWDLAAPEMTMVTVLDADLIISPEYISYVDWVWASDPEAAEVNIMTHTTPLTDNLNEVPTPVLQWELAFFSTITGQCAGAADPRFPLATYTMRMTIPPQIDFWLPGLTGIGEDQMTAVRTYIRFVGDRRTPTLVAIRVPYWCSTEVTPSGKCRQQVRHYLGMQVMWYSWAKSTDLPFYDRVRVTWRACAPFLSAVESPLLLFTLNFLRLDECDWWVRYWCYGLSGCSIVSLVFLAVLCLRILNLWGLAHNGNAYSKLNPLAVIQVLGFLPLTYVVQLWCSTHAKVWLVLAELGYTKVVYQKARQCPEEILGPRNLRDRGRQARASEDANLL